VTCQHCGYSIIPGYPHVCIGTVPMPLVQSEPVPLSTFYPQFTLRDWFAGQALAILADPNDPRRCASDAYELADAMIKAREVPR
jgi:hypothetical protein